MRLHNSASIHPSEDARASIESKVSSNATLLSHVGDESSEKAVIDEVASPGLEMAWIALISWTVLSAPFLVCIEQRYQAPHFRGASPGCSLLLYSIDAALLLYSLRMLLSRIQLTPHRPSSSSSAAASTNRRCVTYFIAGLPALLYPILVHGLGYSLEAAVWVLLLRLALAADLPSRLRGLHRSAEERGVYVHSTYARVMLTFFIMMLYSSFLACVWFRLGCALDYDQAAGSDGPPACRTTASSSAAAAAQAASSTSSSWVLEDVYIRGALDLSRPLSRYARSLHFVVQTIFTIGYGDIHPTNSTEASVALFIILNGSLFYAFLISSLTSLLSNRDATTKLHRGESNAILNYFRSRGVASEVLEQLQSYSEFLFSQGRGVADEAVLCALPRPLSDAIRRGFRDKLLNVPFFQALHECLGDAAGPILDLLLTSSRLRLFAPGTPLVSLGQRRRVMYIVLYGRVEIRMHGSRCALLSLGDGDCIGELSMLLDVGAADFVASAAEFTCAIEISRCSLLRALNVAPLPVGAECTPEAQLQIWRDIQPRLEALFPSEPLVASPTPPCAAVPSPDSTSPSGSELHGTESDARFWVINVAMGDALQAAVLATEQFNDKCRRVQGNIGNKTKRKVMDMLEQLDSVIDWWIVLPDSPLRPMWAVLTVLCIVYYLCAVPMRICVSLQSCDPSESVRQCLSHVDASSAADYIADAVILADVVLHTCCLALVQFDGTVRRVVTDSAEIRRQFLRTPRFLVSVIILLPFDVLSAGTGYLLLLRLNKLISYSMVQGCVEELTSFLHHEWHIMISSEALTVFYLSLNTVVASLWLSAGWVMVSGGDYGFEEAVYWLLTTMTTTGYGDIVPKNTEETLFVIFACVIGPCVCATIIANFVSLLQRDDASAAAVSHRREVLLTFLNSFDDAERGGSSSGSALVTSLLPGRMGQMPPEDMSFVRPGGYGNEGEETYRPHNIYSSAAYPPPASSGPHSTSTVRRLSAGAMKTFYSVASKLPLGAKPTAGEGSATQPKSVFDIVNDYFDALDKNGYSCSESSTLDVRSDENDGENDGSSDTFGMPEYFRNEMKHHLIGGMVMGSGIFSGFGSLMVREIILKMELRYISKFNVIVSSNLAPQFFGLIKYGNIQIYNVQGRRTQRLTQGDYFGVSSLVSYNKGGDSKMCFRAIALGPCEIWTLAPRRFATVLNDFGCQDEQLQDLRDKAVQNFQRITDPLAPAVKVLCQINNLREADKWFLNPHSHEYALWSLVVVVFTVFNALAIPARISFGEQVGWNLSFIVDYVGDLCFLADIVLSLWFVAFYDNDDLVQVRSRIFERYIKSNAAWTHIFALIPLDVLILAFLPTARSSFSTTQVLSMLRVNRMARLFDVQSRSMLLEQKYLTTTARLRNVLRLLKLTCMVLFCSHLIGCAFFFIANYTHLHGSVDNWADAAGLLRDCSLGAANDGGTCSSPPPFALLLRQYVDSIYWAAATIATVGYGDIVAISHREKLYNIFMFLVGTSVYSVAISHLQDIVSQLNITSGTFALRCERINAFLTRECASDGIASDMKLMLEKNWKYCKGATADEIQLFAPAYLYGHLIESCARDAFSSIYFIKTCKRPFIKSITEKLKFNMFLSGNIVFYLGELASSLYILTKGEVKLIGDCSDPDSQDDSPSLSLRSDAPVYGSLLASRAAGSCSIGESEFFMRSYYSCSAKAVTDLICFSISFEDFRQVLSYHGVAEDFDSYHRANSAQLLKLSTRHAVTTFSDNMKHAKMIKMMAPTMTETVKKDFIFMPQSLFCKVWYLIYALLLLYYAFSVPFFIAFGFKSEGIWQSIVILDAVAAGFFGVDIVMNLFYFAVEHHGKIVSSPNQFRSLYVKESLLWDFAAILPLPWFGLLIPDHNYFSFFRVPCLIRLGKIRGVFSKLTVVIENKLGIRLPETLTRIFRTVAMVWYFGHVVSCAFYFVGRVEAHEYHSASWLRENDLLGGTPAMDAYVWGYLWSMYTITTVGYGSISVPSIAERIMAVVVMITGAILCDAGVAAVLGSVIDSRDRRNGAVKRQVDAMNAFCATFRQNIQAELSSSAIQYFQFLSRELGDQNEDSDISILPPSIWMALKHEVSLKPLNRANISSFYNLGSKDIIISRGFINSIIRYFEAYLSYPGQVLDTKSGHLFVLRRGKIVQSSEGGDGSPTRYVEPRTAIFDPSRLGGSHIYTKSSCESRLLVDDSSESSVSIEVPKRYCFYVSKAVVEPAASSCCAVSEEGNLNVCDYEDDTRGALNTCDSTDVPLTQRNPNASSWEAALCATSEQHIRASLRLSTGEETWCADSSGVHNLHDGKLSIDFSASLGELNLTENSNSIINAVNMLLFFSSKENNETSRLSFTCSNFELDSSRCGRDIDITLAQDDAESPPTIPDAKMCVRLSAKLEARGHEIGEAADSADDFDTPSLIPRGVSISRPLYTSETFAHLLFIPAESLRRIADTYRRMCVLPQT